jgi:DNA-binding transcriptional regulator GbsR (MarR family)
VQRHGVAPRVAAEQGDPAGVGPQQAEQDPDGGGLPRSVGTEEAVHLAGRHLEVEPVEGTGRPEGLHQTGDLDRISHRLLNLQKFHKFVNTLKRVTSNTADSNPTPDDAGRDESLLRAVERFGMLLTEAGMPRMSSRLFAFMVIDGGDDYTAGDMGSRLRVSPAAVSGAVRYLVTTGLVVRDRHPGHRADHYRLHSDIWYESTLQRIDILRRWEESLDETIALLGAERAPASLLETRAFVEFVRAEYPEMMERWREHKKTLGIRQ